MSAVVCDAAIYTSVSCFPGVTTVSPVHWVQRFLIAYLHLGPTFLSKRKLPTFDLTMRRRAEMAKHFECYYRLRQHGILRNNVIVVELPDIARCVVHAGRCASCRKLNSSRCLWRAKISVLNLCILGRVHFQAWAYKTCRLYTSRWSSAFKVERFI